MASLHDLLHSKKPMTWVFTGDSVTEGAEWTNGARDYSELLSERVRWDMRRGRDIIINTASSGDKTGDILHDFRLDLHPLQTTNWTLDDPHQRDLPAYNTIIRDVAVSENVILVDNWRYWHQHRGADNLSQWLGNAIHPMDWDMRRLPRRCLSR